MLLQIVTSMHFSASELRSACRCRAVRHPWDSRSPASSVLVEMRFAQRLNYLVGVTNVNVAPIGEGLEPIRFRLLPVQSEDRD